MTVTIDEKGELGGYANYAHRRVANAVVSDVIRTVQAVEMGAGSGLNTAMIVVAAVDIPAGREVRWKLHILICLFLTILFPMV